MAHESYEQRQRREQNERAEQARREAAAAERTKQEAAAEDAARVQAAKDSLTAFIGPTTLEQDIAAQLNAAAERRAGQDRLARAQAAFRAVMEGDGTDGDLSGLQAYLDAFDGADSQRFGTGE